MYSSISKTQQTHTSIPAGMKKRLEELRNIGHYGGIIFKHRAMLTMPMQSRKFVPAVIMALVLFTLYLFGIEWINGSWRWIMQACLDLFHIEASMGNFGFQILGLSVYAPYLDMGAPAPSESQWTWGVIITAITLVVSLLLPERFTPLNYLLRALAFIHICSLFYFAYFANYFPYGLTGYHMVMMLAGLSFISLVPLVYGLTYYIFDASIGKKLGLTLLTMVHLWLFIPLQYFAHAYLIQQFSLLYMPVLFLMFGLMLNVFTFIAFYAWGMSWKGALHPPEESSLPLTKVEQSTEAAAETTVINPKAV